MKIIIFTILISFCISIPQLQPAKDNLGRDKDTQITQNHITSVIAIGSAIGGGIGLSAAAALAIKKIAGTVSDIQPPIASDQLSVMQRPALQLHVIRQPHPEVIPVYQQPVLHNPLPQVPVPVTGLGLGLPFNFLIMDTFITLNQLK
jgi:hypothetical protein